MTGIESIDTRSRITYLDSILITSLRDEIFGGLLEIEDDIPENPHNEGNTTPVQYAIRHTSRLESLVSHCE